MISEYYFKSWWSWEVPLTSCVIGGEAGNGKRTLIILYLFNRSVRANTRIGSVIFLQIREKNISFKYFSVFNTDIFLEFKNGVTDHSMYLADNK